MPTFFVGVHRKRSAVMLFVLYTLCLLVANVGILRALVDHARGNPTASHVIGVPFITLALIWAGRESIFASVQPARFIGGAIVAAGFSCSLAVAFYLGGVENALSVAVAGLVLSWIGGFLLFFGLAAARAALFPLAFLAFTIPIPDALIGAATTFLKVGSTEAVAGLFKLTGTPYFREGFVFSLPTFVIEIADECSGIRSSIALLLTSLLASHRFLSGRWSKTLVMLAVLPMAVLKNGIRIVSLSLLAMHVDESFLTGQLHHEGGIVFFLLALALMLPVFVVLHWWETHRSKQLGTV